MLILFFNLCSQPYLDSKYIGKIIIVREEFPHPSLFLKRVWAQLPPPPPPSQTLIIDQKAIPYMVNN
jgi:hypothetical protein